jgi:hypothetical protein
MTLKQRISAFVKTGQFINRHISGTPLAEEIALHEGLDKVIESAHIHNNWFIPSFVNNAISNIGSFLEEGQLNAFCAAIKEKQAKTVALICAGNVPIVGFHDVMCVLLTGNNALIKLSSDDDILMPFFLKLLAHYEPEFNKHIFFAAGKLGQFDAVIATGSNNTASHLNYYFGKYPHIIRKSRTSVAVLNGSESKEELKRLGEDIFLYFGLGCRNVSKLLVPAGYSFNGFFESIVDFGYVIHNKKYGNNYDYHRAIYLLESIPFLDNNFIMIRESNDLYSPVGVLYYQYYQTPDEIKEYLDKNQHQIQCIVGKEYTHFGYSQRPVITDFADNTNTLEFLLTL